MKRFLFLLIISSALSFISCNNKKDKDYVENPGAIYFDYKITGKEGDDNLTIMLQYRKGDEEGDAVAVGKVMLDGEIVTMDSTKMNGLFYELHKPISTFSGKHQIVFTDTESREFKEEFEFQPFFLHTVIRDSIQRDSLMFEFAGLDNYDYIRVVLTDTSFNNEGINRLDTVVNGRLYITQTDLELLANGSIQLEFIREYERPVKNGTKAGGRLLITYSMKREFILKN